MLAFYLADTRAKRVALLCDTLEYLRSGHEDKDDTVMVKTDDTNKAVSPSPYPMENERKTKSDHEVR